MTSFHLAMNDIESNGLTRRENNLKETHTIPLSTYIEITDCNEFTGQKMFVVGHSRDCDGTPLYDLCFDRHPNPHSSNVETHFPEECLSILNDSKAQHCHILEKNNPQNGLEIFIIPDSIYQWIIKPNDDLKIPEHIMEAITPFVDDETLEDWKKNPPNVNSKGLPPYRAQQLRASFIYGRKFSRNSEVQEYAKNENIILQNIYALAYPVRPAHNWN